VAENSLGHRTEATLAVLAGSPEIRSFVASSAVAFPGDAVTFHWSCDGGDELLLLDATGTPRATIDRAADIDEGRFTLSVPEAPGDYTYTLQVGNSGGTATATADLHVTDGPLVRAFQASATRLTLGETVDLSWQVTADAANREPELQLVDNFGTAYPLSPADRLAGRVTITPDRPGDFLFTLTASTPDTEPSSARVAVLVAPLPRILQFASTPDVLHTEGAVPPFAASLSWETADAAELELWRTNADGEPIPPSLLRLTAASGQQAQIDAGTLPVELPGTGHFLLQVTSSIGITAERSLEVLVDPAEVLSFVALPPDIITGESSTLAWTTRNATVVALQPLEPIVTETRGTFVDISTDPRAVELALDPADNSWALVVFPDQFRFPFDAELHAGVRVAKNGFLSFDLTGTVASHLNAAFPTNATYRYVHLAPFWDQLQSYLHGKVYWLHDDVAGTLTVMWKDWSYRETSSDWDLDFEVVLHANGSFEYRYGTMFGKARSGTTDKQPIADGDNATIGFQDLTGASGLTLSDGEPVDGGLGNRGWIFDLGLAAAGSRQVTPGASRTYTLTALNPDVRRTASTTITVWGVPSIDTASVYPTTPQVGVPYIVSWQASSATRVRLLDEDGGVLCEETRPASVALGQCELVDPATGPRRYTLEASNGIDRNAVTVPVTFTVFPRLTIDSFAISDPFPSSGDTVTVTWTGTGGFEAELYACTPGTAHADCSRLDIAGQDPNAGSHALVIDRSTEFWFRLVDRLYRATEASALAWVDVPSLDSFTASSLQVAPGESVVLTWASTGNTATLTNFPLGDAVEVTAPYEDISTTGTAASFTSTGGGSYLVEFPDGFAFPYFGESYTALMARGDGWAQFVTNDTAAKATNSALPYKTNSKVHLAPFWDDLSTKTNSRVYFRLVEGAGLRHLVVQWTDFQFATTAANPASLNFQAVLFEDGTIEYRYGTMTSSTTRPGYAQGESATLGLQDPSGTVGKMIGNVHNKAVSGGLASRSWRFPLVPEPSGTVVVTPAESTTYRLCVNNESRYEVCDEIRVVVVSPGDLLVSELMVAPGTAAGEWFEIRNTSPDPIDLAGFLFTSGEYDRYTVPDEGAPVVPPGGFVVLARSDDPSVNGLAAPTLVYGDLLDLSDGEDEVAIGYRGTSIDRVAWTNAWSVPTGASLELEPRMLERSPTGNDDAAAWCAATTPYAAGFLGSPGQLGAGCLDTGVYAHYLVDPTSPLPFLDIGTTGTPLNDIWLAPYHTVPLPLGFAFPYFGEVVTDVTILRDGALAFVPIDGNIPSRNAAMPGSGVPDGLVAPMWDILKNPGTASVRYRLLERDGLRVLVVQWTNMSPSMDDGRYGLVTFQAQLWENGDIVFAYGEPEPVRDLSAADYTLNYGGNSTIGILNLAGDEAIQIFFGDTTRGPKVAYGGRAIHFRAK
jgi:hypothetical protein